MLLPPDRAQRRLEPPPRCSHLFPLLLPAPGGGGVRLTKRFPGQSKQRTQRPVGDVGGVQAQGQPVGPANRCSRVRSVLTGSNEPESSVLHGDPWVL